MDPAELWRQWMESGSRMWSEMAQGGRVDPYGAYRRWFEGMREMQERMIGASPEPVAGDPGVDDIWRRWFELSSDYWQKSAEMGQNAMEILPRWMQMLDEARTNLLAGGAPPSDPLQLATQWYNATSGPFSDFVGDVIEREEFLEPSSRFLQSYASFYKVFKRNSEDYLKNLQLPVRSDISRIAGLVVNLEEKVDRIEEVLEDFEYGYAEPATSESVKQLETRLDRVEGKLDRLLVALEGGTQDGGVQADSNGSTVEDVREKEES
jgi:polyhydroxyalkanoic acid synthase PhaR subunit